MRSLRTIPTAYRKRPPVSDLERAEEKLGEPWALTLVERKLILAELARLRAIEAAVRNWESKVVDEEDATEEQSEAALKAWHEMIAVLDSPR